MSKDHNRLPILQALLFAAVFVVVILLATTDLQSSFTEDPFGFLSTILWSQLRQPLFMAVAAILTSLLYFRGQDRQVRPLRTVVNSFLIFSVFISVFYVVISSRSTNSFGLLQGILWSLAYGVEYYVLIFGTALITLAVKNPFDSDDSVSVFGRGFSFLVTVEVSLYYLTFFLWRSLAAGITSSSSFVIASLIVRLTSLLLSFLALVFLPRFFFIQNVDQVIKDPKNHSSLFIAFVLAQFVVFFISFYLIFSHTSYNSVLNVGEMLWLTILGVILPGLVAGYASLCWLVLISSYRMLSEKTNVETSLYPQMTTF